MTTTFCSDGGGAWPLSIDALFFVDSPSSPSFPLLLSALDRASIVAMDAEWKPNSSSSSSAQRKGAHSSCPRVSIMQIAIRIRPDSPLDSVEIHPSSSSLDHGALEPRLLDSVGIDLSHSSSSEGSQVEPSGPVQSDGNHSLVVIDGGGLTEGGLRSEQSEYIDFPSTISTEDEALKLMNNSEEIKFPHSSSMYFEDEDPKSVPAYTVQNNGKKTISMKGQAFVERSLRRLKDKKEMIFLLDMMSLPASSFWEGMKKMLVSPTVLKLGFKFKQDLVNLAKTFPGPDAHSCFDKVDPYVDIGKFYHKIHQWNELPVESLSLANICEKVIGYTLCKDLQCSDWEQRPLMIEQQLYAAADAHCLLVAYDILETDASKVLGYEMTYYHATSSSKDGFAELLHVEGVDLPSSYAKGNIVHARRGIASIMARSAISDRSQSMTSFSTIADSADYLRIAKKFGERLLVDALRSSKVAQRKPKNRGKKVEQMDDCYWFEPPPWDPSLGGDGFPKFLCDNMVEGLAKQLRNVGIDTVSLRKKSDPRKLVELAEKEGRVLLTQDVKLLRRRLIPRNLAYRVKSLSKQEQLSEVVRTFNLIIDEDNLLSRCTKCNGNFIPEPLTPEEAVASVADGQSIPEYAIVERLLFWQCSVCMHMYWQGNQFHRALETFQAFARKVQMLQQ